METGATQAQATGSESSSNKAGFVEVSFRSLEPNPISRKLPNQHAETSSGAPLQVPRHQVRRRFSSSHAATNQLLKFRPSAGRATAEVLELPVQVEVLGGPRGLLNVRTLSI